MKNIYQNPVAEIISLNVEDIIRTSGFDGEEDEFDTEEG